MENTARITGYCVALALLAGMLSIIFTLREGILFPHNRVKVGFPAIGTLMEDDPVKSRGVEIGRVERIEAGDGGAVATLELYRRVTLPKDTRFINYNYSMFGARMVIMVPGTSPEPLDQKVIQQGDFITGVTETIHRVDALMRTVLEYRALTARLEKGDDTTLSIQKMLETQIYPALEQFGRFANDMEVLQGEASAELDRLALAGGQVNRFSTMVAANSDTLVLRANRTLERLAVLTAQSTVLLKGLEELMVAAQDTTRGPSRILMQRDLYDRTLSMTHAIQDFLKLTRKEGFQDVIHFWRNVHIHWGKPASK